MLDETFFVMNLKRGRKYRSAIGKAVRLPYTGRHKVLAMFGTMARNGSQEFKNCEKFILILLSIILKICRKNTARLP